MNSTRKFDICLVITEAEARIEELTAYRFYLVNKKDNEIKSRGIIASIFSGEYKSTELQTYMNRIDGNMFYEIQLLERIIRICSMPNGYNTIDLCFTDIELVFNKLRRMVEKNDL